MIAVPPMPNQITAIADIPSVPAVYAMYGGQGRSQYVAYVGLASKLRGRVEQHLVRKDSSVTTGVSAVSLNPDFVTQVRWWEHPDFQKQDMLEAAELVAFDVLQPSLRSRGGITDRAKQVYAEQEFQSRMRALFAGEPTGVLTLPTLAVALEQIADLRGRVTELEKRLSSVEEAK